MKLEPNQTIKDPNDTGFVGFPPPKKRGDEFDQFLRMTGGPASPRSGHKAAVASHQTKVQCPQPEAPGEYYHGPIGIIPAVYEREEPAMPTCCAPTKPAKSKKR
jgi:hypothetical protein